MRLGSALKSPNNALSYVEIPFVRIGEKRVKYFAKFLHARVQTLSSTFRIRVTEGQWRLGLPRCLLRSYMTSPAEIEKREAHLPFAMSLRVLSREQHPYPELFYPSFRGTVRRSARKYEFQLVLFSPCRARQNGKCAAWFSLTFCITRDSRVFLRNTQNSPFLKSFL